MQGIDLRDYFAGQALAALLADRLAAGRAISQAGGQSTSDPDRAAAAIAAQAYQLADAMLKVKGPPEGVRALRESA